jgi:hypothetical protein
MAMMPGRPANIMASQNANSMPGDFAPEIAAANPILIHSNNMHASTPDFAATV